MKKLKLAALVWSIEDKIKMTKWCNAHLNQFEIKLWSNELTAPIQAAVAHYCESEGIDGLLIDDHVQYDSIVMNRVADYLKASNLSLYSVSNGAVAIFAAPQKVQKFHPAAKVANSAPSLVRAS